MLAFFRFLAGTFTPLRPLRLPVIHGEKTQHGSIWKGELAEARQTVESLAEDCRQATGSEPFAFLTNSNGSLSRIVRMPDHRWRLLAFNETEHLDAGAETGARGADIGR